MREFYQNPVNIYFQNNKDQIYGFIMGLLLLLTIFKQSIGLPMLFIFIIAIGGLIKPRKEYLIISGLLIFKIIIISIITKNNLHDINVENIKILVRRIIVDVILLFMLFVALKDNVKKGFYYFCILLFSVDFLINIQNRVSDVIIYGYTFGIRPGDLMARGVGLIGHPFYSVCISLVGLFAALSLKNRFVVMAAAISILANGSQRGLISLMVIGIFYGLYYFKYKKFYIYLISAGILVSIFFGVFYLAAHYGGLTAHNERIFRWGYGFDVLASSWDQWGGYLRFYPEYFSPNFEYLKDFNRNQPLFLFNAESYYLSDLVNYGIVIGLISAIIFFYIYQIKEKELNAGKYVENFSVVIFSYFIFLDCFYSYNIGALLVIFFYCVHVVTKPANFKTIV